MTEEQVKFICKWIIENSSQPFTDLEKEVLKQAVDSSKNLKELINVVILSRMLRIYRAYLRRHSILHLQAGEVPYSSMSR